MAQTKNDWRRALLKARSAVPRDVRRRNSVAIAAHVRQLPCLDGVRSVLGYRAIGAEVDVSHVLALPALARLPHYYPVIRNDTAPTWTRWSDAPVADPQFGSVSAADVCHPLVVVVPGVGFDARGVRLGRGAGFYDRALADLRRAGLVYAVGVAFECQIVPALPVEAWDERVDWVVTEQRVIGCAKRRAGVAEAAR